MTPEDWRRVRELFEAALDVEPSARADWLRAQPVAPALRDEVASLIEHDARAGAFMDVPVADRVPALLDEDEAFAPGTQVGHYRIVQEIGRGATGRVYRAEDQHLGRPVALKALAPHLTGDASYRERLRREARAAAGLSHPGISIVYAFEETDGQLFIVSELIEGHTLRDEIAGGALPDTAAIAATARELAEALAAAHERGITHRDFKPENVMRDRAGRLKVLDFGLAYSADSGALAAGAMTTLPGVLVGTPAYMAPEQLKGHRADARSDVFAYGVVMYEYASGVHPFGASTPLGLVARVLESEPQPLEARARQSPARFAAIVDRCLRKSPADRFATAGEIVAALAAGGFDSARTRSTGIGVWWRAHQAALMGLYVCAATLAWSIKEAFRSPLTLWAFVAVSAGAAVGGIARGHLLFTSAVNLVRLKDEQRRVRRTLLAVDLSVAAVLAADGVIFAPNRPLWAVLTIALAAGIALAALLMEPATSAATFTE